MRPFVSVTYLLGAWVSRSPLAYVLDILAATLIWKPPPLDNIEDWLNCRFEVVYPELAAVSVGKK